MKPRQQLEETRRAILDAMAHVVVESKDFGFSVQQVADRAGVTHRTVYNHFPTREAMSEGLATYLEERMATRTPRPDENVSLEAFPTMIPAVYRCLLQDEVHARANVLLMIASRAPVGIARARLRVFEGAVEREAKLPPNLSARQLTATIRMFVSSMGWHVLTEHFGLSSREAGAAAAWATQTLVNAVSQKPKARAQRKRRTSEGEAHANKPKRD